MSNLVALSLSQSQEPVARTHTLPPSPRGDSTTSKMEVTPMTQTPQSATVFAGQAALIRALKNLDGQPLREDWCAICSLPVVQSAAVYDNGRISAHKVWVHDETILRSLGRAVRMGAPPAHSCIPGGLE